MADRYQAVLAAIISATENASMSGLHGPELQAHAFIAAYDALKAADAPAPVAAPVEPPGSGPAEGTAEIGEIVAVVEDVPAADPEETETEK